MRLLDWNCSLQPEYIPWDLSYERESSHSGLSGGRSRARIASAALPGRPVACRGLGEGADGGFITGSDYLVDGGVTASYFYGALAPQ